jgi:hypothetical protein
MSFEKTISFRRFMVLNENEELQIISSDIVDQITTANKIAAAGITDVSTQLNVITNYIRQVIQGSWVGQEDELQNLQLVAYNIEDLLNGDGKSPDSSDISSLLNACISHIQDKILSKAKGPINNLAVNKKYIPAGKTDDKMVAEPENTSGLEQSPIDSGMEMDKSALPPLGGPTDEARPNS